MKTKFLASIFVLALLACAPATAQSPVVASQHFAKDGLSFDYPADWTLTDKSNATGQALVLTLPDSSATIQVVAFRELLESEEQVQITRETVTLPYARNLATQLGSPVSQLVESADCLPIGNRFASGFKLTGVLNKQPSTGYVYTIVLGQRYMNLIYVRADKDDERAAEGWKLLYDTLKVETPANQSPEAAKLDNIVPGGVLNGRSIKKPPPDYPAAALSARAQGTVTVKVTVDESGKVVNAKAVGGHPLLRGAGEDAARKAKFAPTLLCGRPVSITGLITYNFVLR